MLNPKIGNIEWKAENVLDSIEKQFKNILHKKPDNNKNLNEIIMPMPSFASVLYCNTVLSCTLCQ